MSRNAEYQFISTDTDALVSNLIDEYEQMTGITVQPASPEKLFISWIASVIVQERVLNNYTGNQNIPSRAEGENLDALGDLFYDKERPEAQAAKTTQRCNISAVQTGNILIASGTRFTDSAKTLIWETTADAYIIAGDLYSDVMIQCQTTGTVGNGYVAGQINTVIDPYEYFDTCQNITTSDGGTDISTDDEYYEMMRASQDAYSNAGAKGGYIYFAKQVSTEIADVVVNSQAAGTVNIYALMSDGTAAGTEIKNAILAACNDDFVRPLTDFVVVEDPETVTYNIEVTYYIANGTTQTASEIQTEVDEAIETYKTWQTKKQGRDINPSYLMVLLMETGIKRAEITAPVFTALSDGSDNTVPQIAKISTVSVTNGGYENE
jgi:phage-related baseplate assembly protein